MCIAILRTEEDESKGARGGDGRKSGPLSMTYRTNKQGGKVPEGAAKKGWQRARKYAKTAHLARGTKF
jgi:hypothetical protein